MEAAPRKFVPPPSRRPNPRAEYRMEQSKRINDSSSLTVAYPKLKSLKVDLEYVDSETQVRNGGMKYKANLEHAKSMFCFNCPSNECVGGDFDLSKELSKAIAKKVKVISGELRCQGTRHNRDRKEKTPCQTLLRYKLSLGY